MANGDVLLSRREHRAVLAHLATLEKHHTKRLVNGQVVEPSFPHDDETHEDEVRDCPQCEVLESVFALRRLLLPEPVPPKRKVVQNADPV